MSSAASKAKDILKSVFYNEGSYKKAMISGTKFNIPVNKSFHPQHLKSYEDYFHDFIELSLKLNPGLFVDVGVNVGQILLKMKSIEPSRAYVGFEASVPCCAYVYDLIDANAIKGCKIIPFGLSDQACLVPFYYSSAVDPQATIVQGFWTGANQRSYERFIYVSRGDEVLATLGTDTVGIIKIDVEGGELEVLKGLVDTIGRDRPLILSEVLPFVERQNVAEQATMLRRRQRCEELTRLIESLDYVCLRALPGFQVEEVESFGAQEFVADRTNYVMLPREQKSVFLNALRRKAA